MNFIKMHSNANDFVIIDRRNTGDAAIDYAAIAHRKTGVGCDQVVTIDRSDGSTDCTITIHNPDGSQAAMCGNAAMCVGKLLMDELGTISTSITIGDRTVVAEKVPTGRIRVNLGSPKLAWQDIPIARECDTLQIPLSIPGYPQPVGVNMGNPHVVFFVASVKDCKLEELGPLVEHDSMFPQRTNVCVAEVVTRNQITLRVWERGTGETCSCGSGSCAALIAGVRLGATERKCVITMPGGSLLTEWQESGDTVVSSGVTESFRGVL
ncbi:diaminopimelate epimerase [Anaplasma centrale str. Israel]|uniref:Diaminopimelate epimerase n=1 Tax=Anaplasma centrale (strain Israel) TaxID=574556 RepID=D1ATB2_ANACI|nr:diaminopimelate epimerase [Anaplasma centrale]ACZ48790.1 diaminopimelate epimerase [Anaplasma centrale str. Israel]